MSVYSTLKPEQKEAIGLLQVGTFLEYFDLMLYVHMAVLLNELFFPKTDPHTAALLSAFAFCATYILRPFGALVFGWVGDNIGRKPTVIITTMIMAMSCIVMANLPTYAQIGIGAAWGVTICRILQGFSSMGEIMGAMVYVTEITKPPSQYYAVTLIPIASSLGGVAALGIATLVTTVGFNWRVAFWIGAAVAVVGSVARTRLRETPEFTDAKRRMKVFIEKSYQDGPAKADKILKSTNLDWKKKIDKKTIWSCFLMQCGWPFTFYFSFVYFNPLLKESYGYSAQDIIFSNFLLSFVMLTAQILSAKLSIKFHPLKILRVRASLFSVMFLVLPFVFFYPPGQYQIFAIQALLLLTFLGPSPADAIMIRAIPIFKRFTITSFMYALSRAVIYVITSFGLVYLTEWFGYYGIWAISLPVCAGFLWGVNHFTKLEKLNESYVAVPPVENATWDVSTKINKIGR